jgi:hypothetical protein
MDGQWEFFSVTPDADEMDRRTAVVVKTHIAREEDVLTSFHSTLFQHFGMFVKRHAAGDNDSAAILRDEAVVKQ